MTRYRFFLLLGCVIGLGIEAAFQTTHLFAQTLPLTDDLTPLASLEAQVLSWNSEAQFAQTGAIARRWKIVRQGLTLTELEGISESYPITANIHHGADVTLDPFRTLIVTNLAEADNFVVVNDLQQAIAQEWRDHLSSIAAYDQDTDQFLILDVSRYQDRPDQYRPDQYRPDQYPPGQYLPDQYLSDQHPPVWVSAEELWQATNTMDSVIDSVSDQPQGFLFMSPNPPAKAALSF